MRVGVKKTDMATVDGPPGKLGLAVGLIRPYVGGLFMQLQKSPNPILHSPAILPSGIVRSLNMSSADILNLHWINNEFLTIEDIGRLRKPIVWTLHDMWPFCGAEHYVSDDMDARWRKGYLSSNRPNGHSGLDIDRWVWHRKLRAWRGQMNFVTPSRWLADCVKGSALLGEKKVVVIPNPLDTNQFQPWPKQLARQMLGLPPDAPLVLFGAIGGGADPRKGWDLLRPALVRIAKEVPSVESVIFGQSKPANPPQLGLPVHWMGHLSDDITLSLIYSAADVMVVPSRQENLPQSGTEAQACGCPVVAFNCTGLPDVVEHGETGYLAAPYDAEDLANGIRWVLEDRERYLLLSAAARARAVSLWAEEVVVPQYLAVYQQAIENYCS
jgi:glycosyltransferase involved in cell wall biosynthesis